MLFRWGCTYVVEHRIGNREPSGWRLLFFLGSLQGWCPGLDVKLGGNVKRTLKLSGALAFTLVAVQPVAVVQPDQIKRRPFGNAALMLVALILVLNSALIACRVQNTQPMRDDPY